MLRALTELLTRPFRRRSSIYANGEPRRLLALVSLRRGIIDQALHLTGRDADEAAYALAARLRARLGDETLTASERHLLAVGLVSAGRRDAFDLFLETLPDPPPPISIMALRLVLPLPVRLRKPTDGGAILDWFRRHYRRLKWDEGNERFTL